jgi:flagellar biosynthetic protein FlhB
MSDPQRTHKATPKRVREFRKRGEIALSRDLVSAATLGGGVIALVTTGRAAISGLMELTRSAALASDGTSSDTLPGDAMHTFISTTAPVLIGAAIAAIVAILGQLGWPPAFKSISIDISRMSPMKNLPNTFGLGGMTRRTGAALAKLAGVAIVVVVALRGGVVSDEMQANSLLTTAGALIARALMFVLGALVALAAIDYYLSRRKMGAQMKMTPDEVKREHREAEGDPHIKGKRRQKMRELAKRRISMAVAKADVVVVNPTHYAVALRYDDKSDRAPIVVAKGVDELAEKIREVARKHAVPVLSRPPLARALHKHVKEGRPIPANLYKAVAEVLAYVYRLRRGAHG